MTRFFWPEVERTIGVVAGVALVGAIALPLGWGYEQRQQARTWQETACVYRLREVARESSLPVASDRRGNACTVLRDLGLELDVK